MRSVHRVHGEGWTIGNVDCTLICERPRLAPRRDELESRLSEVVAAPVAVKASTTEKLGALGRAEGIACLAVTVLTR